MRHAVFGPTKTSRGDYYVDLGYVSSCLKSVSDVSAFILGGGKGVEQLAERYAHDAGIDVELVRPNFHSLFHSKTKNPRVSINSIPIALRQTIFAQRNDEIINKADRVVVFWDGEFIEIGQLILRAKTLKKLVIIFPV